MSQQHVFLNRGPGGDTRVQVSDLHIPARFSGDGRVSAGPHVVPRLAQAAPLVHGELLLKQVMSPARLLQRSQFFQVGLQLHPVGEQFGRQVAERAAAFTPLLNVRHGQPFARGLPQRVQHLPRARHALPFGGKQCRHLRVQRLGQDLQKQRQVGLEMPHHFPSQEPLTTVHWWHRYTPGGYGLRKLQDGHRRNRSGCLDLRGRDPAGMGSQQSEPGPVQGDAGVEQPLQVLANGILVAQTVEVHLRDQTLLQAVCSAVATQVVTMLEEQVPLLRVVGRFQQDCTHRIRLAGV